MRWVNRCKNGAHFCTQERDFFHQKSASLDLRALYYMYKITRYLLTLSSSLHLYHLCVFVSWIFYLDRGMNGSVRVFCSSNLESTVTITTDGAFEVSSVDTVTRWILFIDPKLPQTFIITYIRLYSRLCEVLRLTFDTILFSIRRYLYYLGCSEYRVEEAWVRWTDSSTFLFSTLLILFVKKSEHAFDISIRQSPNARGITFEDML